MHLGNAIYLLAGKNAAAATAATAAESLLPITAPQ